MKIAAQPIIRLFGFKRVLIGNAFIVSGTFMAYAFFTKTTPHILMIAILLTGGFFRSLGFTALQSLTFADVPQERMSRASVMMSMSQPLAQSIGIAAAATMVHTFSLMNGDGAQVQAHSITPAFLILGLTSLTALFWYIPLPKNVAEEVSGHVGKKRWQREAEAEAAAEVAAAGDETETMTPAPREPVGARPA
jgi:MFS family permease